MRRGETRYGGSDCEAVSASSIGCSHPVKVVFNPFAQNMYNVAK